MILETQVSLEKMENDKNILFRKDLSDFWEANVATILTQSISVFPQKREGCNWLVAHNHLVSFLWTSHKIPQW